MVARLVADEARRDLWVGARRWFALSFCVSVVLLGVLFLLAPTYGPLAWWQNTLFVLAFVFLSVGVLGVEVSDLSRRRREKRERRAAARRQAR